MGNTDAASSRIRSAWVFLGAALLFALFFAVWTWLAVTGDTIQPLDEDIAKHFRDADVARWWGLMVLLTDLGGVASMVLLTFMGVVWQASHGRYLLVLAWVGVALGGGTLNTVLKRSFVRDRPPPEWRDRAVLETNHSYPSGHAMGSAVGYGMLCYALYVTFGGRRAIPLLIVLAAVAAGSGFSRVFLRAHWFSDVIGGWAIGLAWLCFGLAWLEKRRQVPKQSTV